MFLIDWIIDIAIWFYDLIYDLVFWVFDGIVFMVTKPDVFVRRYGLIILMITILVITVISIANWVTKRYPFQRVYMAPPDKPRNKRFIGRKLIFFKNGGTISGVFYKMKLDQEYWDKFDGLLYFVYPKTIWKIPIGFSVNRILIPKEEGRTTWKWKSGFKWKKDLIINYTGMKEHYELAATVASNESKGTIEAVGPEFFMKAGKQKIELADKMAQHAVTANAESQQYQQALGSVPHNQDYREMTEREIASVYLKKEEDEDIEPEELSEDRVDNIMRELEVGASADR